MGDLSPHFSKSEFRDHRTGQLRGPDPELVQVLERLRSTDGQALRIVSGYRSPATNSAVGGAPKSWHLRGMAADVESRRFSVAQALHAGARGVGYDRCGWVIHVDVRPGAAVTFLDEHHQAHAA